MVDPLDGTKEFIKRNGEFTVNIALIENGLPTLGVIYVPVKKSLYFGEINSGGYRVDDITDLQENCSLQDLFHCLDRYRNPASNVLIRLLHHDPSFL